MIELAQKGFYCSQILLSLGLEAQGKSNPDLVRTMAGLAGGIGFTGDTCGALTGGACLLALYAGKGEPSEEEDPRLNIMIEELVAWFSKEFGELYGGIQCRVILDDDPNNRNVRCPTMVLGVFEKVKELLVENGFDFSRGKP
jgi:C_GCAxxG_C_C family probable redox protein